jgi:PAS domain S-box-containing protein
LLGAVVLEVDRDLSEASQEAINWLVSTVSLILDGLLAARRLRSLVSRSSDALVVLALDGSVGYVAPSVTRTLGYSTFLTLGHPLNEFVHPDDIARLAAALTPPVRDTQLEVRWRHADGSWRDTETTVADLSADPEVEGIALAVRDITERKVLEWELRNSYKLQAVGQLAGGVAHEINTPVQFITDNLQFLQEAFTALLGALGSYRQVLGRGRPPGGSVADELAAIDEAAELGYLNGEVPSALSQALDGAQRVANIVRALKAFGHPDTGEPVPTDVNEVMRNTLTMARNEMKYVADVTEDLGDLPAAMVVPGDIGQVFLNLVVNAAHAIAEKVEGTRDRGHIAVSTRCEGDTAVIRISDDGMGIRDEIRERIFEPFFTTKDVGKGTGQGLALARATVEAHGGSLDFESVPGVGTTFITRLPLRGGTAPEGADASTSSPGKARAHR